jgi:type VI secretion system secreted protein VgrG
VGTSDTSAIFHAKRIADLVSPAGDSLLLWRASIVEELGRPSRMEVQVLCEKPLPDESALLGAAMAVRVRHDEMSVDEGAEAERFYHGIATHIAHRGLHLRYQHYTLTLESWPALLDYTQDCRIFQDKTVPEILDEVFARHGAIATVDKGGLSGSYAPWKYCVQYNETDFAFVTRLMGQEGIYYYFEHAAGKHTLMLCDSGGAHSPSSGFEVLPLRAAAVDAERGDRHSISAWSLNRRLQSGAYTTTDYDFERPSVSLKQLRENAAGVKASAHNALEVFNYPGEYTQEGIGADYVRQRLEALHAQHQVAAGSSTSSGMACGAQFTLKGHPADEHNKLYLLTRTHTEIVVSDYEAHGQDERAGGNQVQARVGGGGKGSGNNNLLDAITTTFSALDAAIPFKLAYQAARNADKPKVAGPQTAVVVGPAGEEIYTDKYARVKVQFHWDRYGKRDENSSCWVRVAQVWAGKNFGFMAIPRIGQEVIVDFLNGDIDEPLITGRVYNAEQIPPWDLPGNATQTGVLTRSFKQGAYSNANSLRFEDKRGEEQLWLHAEKDQLTEVENDEKKWVGRDRVKDIDRDETNHIKRDRTETVDHDETITVHNDRKERVDHNETISIGDNRAEDVGKNETISIGNNRTEDVGDNETVTIGKNRSMTVGSSEQLNVGTSKTDSIGKNHTISIGMMKTETIGMAYMQNVGLGRMENVGLGYSLNVGMIMSTVVGLNQMSNVGKSKSVNVGDKYDITVKEQLTITVGKSVLMMKADGTITLNGNTFELGTTAEQTFKADGNITLKAPKILEN